MLLKRHTLRASEGSCITDTSTQPLCKCLFCSIFSSSTNSTAHSTPETFDIVSNTVDIAARKNLAQISKILAQITSGVEFGDDNPNYIPINDYVRKAIAQMTAWMVESKKTTSSHAI